MKMKIQSSNVKKFFWSLLIIQYSLLTVVFAAEKWQGVDDAVVEKIAKEHGREAMKPFINTDQGDLLLFVFLAAGAAGGFIAGYSWRVLITEKKSSKKEDEDGAGT